MKFCPARRSLTPSSCIRAYDKILPLARIGDSGFHTVANWSLIEEALGREQDFSANLQQLYSRLRQQTPLARIGDSGFHTVANWSLIEEALGREQDFSANLTGVLYRGADGHPDCFALPYGLLLQAFLD